LKTGSIVILFLCCRKINEYAPESEVIVAVNGEHQQAFNENYRNIVLEFISRHKKVYPNCFPPV
jgi:hypothetical protein